VFKDNSCIDRKFWQRLVADPIAYNELYAFYTGKCDLLKKC